MTNTITCPCCKYQPERNKNGYAKKKNPDFTDVIVGFYFIEDIDRPYDTEYKSEKVSLQCPKCGVLFNPINND